MKNSSAAHNRVLKVMLITPPPENFQEKPQRCWPPINLVQIAGPLLAENIEVEIFDANALSLSAEQVCDYVSEARPDVLGMPLYSEQLGLIYRLSAAIKQALPKCYIVLGGPHASVLPGSTLQQFRHVDFVLCGEADKSFSELCLAIREGKGLSSVSGLSYRSAEGAVIYNKDVEVQENLDALLHPKRELLSKYYNHLKYNTIILPNRNIDTLITSRGCPFQCNFCHNITPLYRVHSVDYLMEEILAMYRRGIEIIEVVDDNFTVDRSRAMNLFRRLIKERLKISFRIKSRVDTVDEELLRFAKKAGVYLIAYGAESGSQEILDRMNKKIKVNDIVEACRIAKESNILCHTSWILGYPGETVRTINQTLVLIKAIMPTTVQIEILKPYPLTAVYNEAINSKNLHGDWEPSATHPPWVGLPWVVQYSELQKLRKQMLRSVYITPQYIFNFSVMAAKTFNYRLVQYAFQELMKVLS